jgi:polyhydroxyalkanoate synthesis regulator phasin
MDKELQGFIQLQNKVRNGFAIIKDNKDKAMEIIDEMVEEANELSLKRFLDEMTEQIIENDEDNDFINGARYMLAIIRNKL